MDEIGTNGVNKVRRSRSWQPMSKHASLAQEGTYAKRDRGKKSRKDKKESFSIVEDPHIWSYICNTLT